MEDTPPDNELLFAPTQESDYTFPRSARQKVDSTDLEMNRLSAAQDQLLTGHKRRIS